MFGIVQEICGPYSDSTRDRVMGDNTMNKWYEVTSNDYDGHTNYQVIEAESEAQAIQQFKLLFPDEVNVEAKQWEWISL